MKSYKYRIYPTKEQTSLLDRTFDICRFTYNQLLDFLNKQETVDKNKVSHEIVNLKKIYPELKLVYSKTLQYESFRA